MGEEKLQLNDCYEQIITDLNSNGYSIQNTFLSPLLVEQLRVKVDLIEKQKLFVAANIGNGAKRALNTEQRKDHVYWIHNSKGIAERYFFDEINSFTAYLNYHCFAGINGYEFHYAKYEPSAFYKKHVDGFKSHNQRKLSIITYLNKNWIPSDGGELVIYPLGKSPVVLQPTFGTSIIFKSTELMHEVKSTQKTRYSLTGWLK